MMDNIVYVFVDFLLGVIVIAFAFISIIALVLLVLFFIHLAKILISWGKK